MNMDAPPSPSPGEHEPITGQPATPARDHDDVLGRRVGAALIDLLCLTAVAIAIAALSGGTAAGDGSASFVLTGPALVAFALVTFGYYLVLEATVGRTIGKALLRLRVADRDDGRPTVLAVAGRTVLRVVDWLPAFYLIGFVTMLATGRRRQRLGDLAAGTRVIRAAPARHRAVAGVALASVVVLALGALMVSVLTRSGLLTGGTSSSSTCINDRCNATARGDQVVELSGHVVAISGIGDGRATFQIDGDRANLMVDDVRQVGDSLVRLTSVEGDVATFSIDFTGLFVERADPDAQDGDASTADDEVADTDTTDDDADTTDGTTTTLTYMRITDDQRAISVEVPTAWDDIDGRLNVEVGPSVHAARNLRRFRNTWDVPGIIVDLSPKLGHDDVVDVLYELEPADACTADGRRTFDNAQLTGMIELWSDCGGGSTTVVTASLAARDGDGLIAVFGQALRAQDRAAIDHALETVEILATGPDTATGRPSQATARADRARPDGIG